MMHTELTVTVVISGACMWEIGMNTKKNTLQKPRPKQMCAYTQPM